MFYLCIYLFSNCIFSHVTFRNVFIFFRISASVIVFQLNKPFLQQPVLMMDSVQKLNTNSYHRYQLQIVQQILDFPTNLCFIKRTHDKTVQRGTGKKRYYFSTVLPIHFVDTMCDARLLAKYLLRNDNSLGSWPNLQNDSLLLQEHYPFTDRYQSQGLF